MNAEEETDDWAPQHWSRQEWFYMWTKGLDPRRIAKICRVPYRKVYDHIRTRVNHNPALFGQRLMLHDHPQLPPGGLGNRRRTWQDRAFELVEFRRVHGRFPRGYLDDESKLYSFLQYQRDQYREGRLPEHRNSYLNGNVPGWLTPRKLERETALWEQRAGEYVAFLQFYGRHPSYKTARDARERTLCVWMKRQRQCFRTGRLTKSRSEWLSQKIPDWNSVA